jgi:hypothetical protein
MARQEMLMAKCDRKECRTVVEIDRATEAPEGWFEVRVEIEGKFDTRSKLEFCSEKCVSAWARSRGQYLNNGSSPPRPVADTRNMIREAIEVINADHGGGATRAEIQGLVDRSQNTIDTHLRDMVDSGLVALVRSDSPRSYALPVASGG